MADDNKKFNYTESDFRTPAPYEEILKIEDPFEQSVLVADLAAHAKVVGFVGFKKMLSDYRESRKRAVQVLVEESNITDFERAGLELITGEWIANENGVYRYGQNGYEYACMHPIYPCERQRNIDTGETKLTLAYKRGRAGGWKYLTVDYDIAMNAKNIVQLARMDISVASGRRAQNLVDYIADVVDLNYDNIPERKSVSRFGWNSEGFSPYIGDVIFDGNGQFENIFAAVKSVGSYEKWLEEVKRVREQSLTARIVIAASFASVLVEPLGCSPFFVHMWGGSDTGKSVSQMVAASVWAEPSIGGNYFQSFKATSAGLEVMAGFLNSMPLIMDELQLVKGARGKFAFNVYELASGAGKLRSNKSLGIAASTKWRNCFITSGESPIVTEQDEAGALNRVIEIECKEGEKVIFDGHRTAEVVRWNYGWAGRKFIEYLHLPETLELAKKRYAELFKIYTAKKVTDKQSHAAAILTVADEMIACAIFGLDGGTIKPHEMAEFLKSIEMTSMGKRGYQYICDWVSQNANRFRMDNEIGDIYGVMGEVGTADDGYVYIIRSVFNYAVSNAGMSPAALLSYLKSKELIQTRPDGRGYEIMKRLTDGTPARCVKLKIDNAEQQENV